MPGSGHHRVVCSHGVLLTQCRCPGPKETRVETCSNPAHAGMKVTHGTNGEYIGKHRKPGTPVVSSIRSERPGTRPRGRHLKAL